MVMKSGDIIDLPNSHDDTWFIIQKEGGVVWHSSELSMMVIVY